MVFVSHSDIQYSAALGNNCPEGIRKVENALWRSILGVAAGHSVESEMAKFVDTYQAIEKTSSDSFMPDWFSLGRSN